MKLFSVPDRRISVTTNEISLPAPDDWHAHFRFGDVLKAVVPWSARQFKRVMAMGNVPAVETVEQALEYDGETNAQSSKYGCKTIVSPKLTLETLPETVEGFSDAGFHQMKLYAGITTGSAHGITSFHPLYPCFEVMQALSMVLQIHAEDCDPIIDYDRREPACLPKVEQIVKDFPRLRIVVEHISCAETVDFMRKMWVQRRLVGATVSLQHFKHNKNDVLGDHGDPHLICKPPIQGFRDQKAIQELVMADRLPCVFHGSDTAPHLKIHKGPDKIRSGVFSAPVLMPEWLRLFVKFADVDAFTDFTNAFGADFYQVQRNKERLVMVRRPWTVPDLIGGCRPYMAGEQVEWDVEGFV